MAGTRWEAGRKQGRSGSRTFEVEIEKLVYGGQGLAHHEGKVVFVPFTAPGDKVRVRPVDVKKNYVRAVSVELLHPGPGRVEAPCRYFGRCGGCQWQHLEYPSQVEVKRQILEEIFHHRFPSTTDLPITMTACPHPYGYRSRTRLQLRGWGEHCKVGYFRLQSHAVEDIEECALLREPLNEALRQIRKEQSAEDADWRRNEVEIACATEDGSWKQAVVAEQLEQGFSSADDSMDSPEGIDSLERQVEGFAYRISPEVFFQANDFMVGELVRTVLGLIPERSAQSALELFAGVGLLSLPLSTRFEKVIAVESSVKAARFCEENAQRAGLGNLTVVCSEAASWMDRCSPAPSFTTIILDPPRSGAGPETMQRILAWAPESIIYVSCDPHTLARDISLLTPEDYRIDSVRGLDMFPQTFHLETVVRLRRDDTRETHSS